MSRAAIIIHGFAGSPGLMKEIEETFSTPPLKKHYTDLNLVDFYPRLRG